jgi:hypothetical protein
MTGDHGLPILGQDAGEPWGVPELAPTTLLGLIEEDPPGSERVTERLASVFGSRITFHGPPPEQPAQAAWAIVFEVEGHASQLVIWSEPVMSEALQVPPFAANARSIIGIQSMLDPEDPLASWSLMISLIGGAVEAPAALLDIETEQWFSGEEVATRLLGEDPTPEETMLFRIHAASTVEQPGEGDHVWLRTLGMHRCGRPELEMLEVDGRSLPLAHDLMEAVGALCLHRGAPEPGFAFEGGVNVFLSLQRLEGQLELLKDSAVGTRAHRIGMGASDDGANPMLSGRAVICGAEPRGSYREIHAWPKEAIDLLARGEAGLERTEQWTRSMSMEAQRLWPRMLEGIGDGHSAEVCVVLSVEDGGGREQVWIEVEAADSVGVSGRLLSTPAQVNITPGASLTASLGDVVDWRLLEQGKG